MKKQPTRDSFDINEDDIPEKNQGLKLKPSKSHEQKIIPSQQALEEYAEDVTTRLQQYFSEAHDLGIQFLNLIKDKNLQQNKGPIQKSLEREVCNKLHSYVERVNNDDQHPQNDMGSASVITLLLAVTLKLRDRCNETEFKLKETADECAFLKRELLEIKAKVSSSPPTLEK